MPRQRVSRIPSICLLALVLLVSRGATAFGADKPWTSENSPMYSGIGGVTAPELDPPSKVQPAYPEKGRHAHVEAQCILEPIILKDGTIGPLEVERCTFRFKDGTSRTDVWPRQKDEYGFAQASFDAVKQWRYKPATLNGEAVDAIFTVVVTFLLDPPKHTSEKDA